MGMMENPSQSGTRIKQGKEEDPRQVWKILKHEERRLLGTRRVERISMEQTGQSSDKADNRRSRHKDG